MCFKKASFLIGAHCTFFISLPWDYVTQLEKEKPARAEWKIQPARGLLSGFFRGQWMQRRGRQRDVTTQCEMGFKPMLLWLHGLWAPWQSLVCFRAAAHSFCSPQIQFYCFTVFLRATCNVAPPFGPFPYLSQPLMCSPLSADGLHVTLYHGSSDGIYDHELCWDLGPSPPNKQRKRAWAGRI